jgi:hypothetical protein
MVVGVVWAAAWLLAGFAVGPGRLTVFLLDQRRDCMRAQPQAPTPPTSQHRPFRLALVIVALFAGLAALAGVVGLLLGEITFWVVEDGPGIHKLFDPGDAPWREVDEP